VKAGEGGKLGECAEGWRAGEGGKGGRGWARGSERGVGGRKGRWEMGGGPLVGEGGRW
jgi:hypothetical protein